MLSNFVLPAAVAAAVWRKIVKYHPTPKIKQHKKEKEEAARTPPTKGFQVKCSESTNENLIVSLLSIPEAESLPLPSPKKGRLTRNCCRECERWHTIKAEILFRDTIVIKGVKGVWGK